MKTSDPKAVLKAALKKITSNTLDGWSLKEGPRGTLTVNGPKGLVRINPVAELDEQGATKAMERLRARGYRSDADANGHHPHHRPDPTFVKPVAMPTTTDATPPKYPGDPSPDEGVVQRLVLLTPKLAQELLDRKWEAVTSDGRRLRQRDLSGEQVDYFCGLLRAGQFKPIYQGLGIGENGSLYDGQHRAHAVVRTGISVEVQVTFNVPADHIDALDSGRQRRASTKFTMDGYDHGLNLGSAARLLSYFLDYEIGADLGGGEELVGEWRNWHKNKIDDPTILDLVRHKHPGLYPDVQWAVAQRQTKPVLNIPSVAVFRYIARRAWPEGSETIDSYLDTVVCGIGIDSADHVALAVKRWLERQDSDQRRSLREAHLNILIRAYNVFIKGRPQKSFQASLPGPFPLPYRPASRRK